METRYIYANNDYKIKQTNDFNSVDIDDQIKTFSIILYYLLGQGVIKELANYLAKDFNINRHDVDESITSFCIKYSEQE
jgi:hypothetical protein